MPIFDPNPESTAFLKRVRNFEDNFTERKPETVKDGDIRKAIVAFANSVPPDRTGLLCIGVSDDGEIQGVSNPDKFQKRLRQICGDCYPPIKYGVEVVPVDGKQVAVVVPTTLLARQHFKTFTERFKGLPLRIAQASRLVGAKEIKLVKAGMEDGSVDIVIGTHALLADSVKFRDLGLMIIDEEQHFGVKHKERLKQMRANVHVLTLSATPIPRTLQLALSGVREMSLITTPPLDRLAVRTYIAPFDPVIIREHLLREHFRGGQSFYVVPRITDLDEIAEFLRENVPEVKFRTAHGRMPPTELEDIMTGFYDRAFDVLLSTTIVESGLDISTANTLVILLDHLFYEMMWKVNLFLIP